jgi:serine/threonine protein kinase
LNLKRTKVPEVDLSSDHALVVMEPLQGQSLRAVLTEKLFSLSQVIEIGTRLCETLDYAETHLPHGAISADSIWVYPDDRIKLLDSGLASVLARDATLPVEPRGDQRDVARLLRDLLADCPTSQVTSGSARSQVPVRIRSALERAMTEGPETGP